MAVTCFYFAFCLVYSNVTYGQPYCLSILLFPNAAGISEFYEVPFYGCFGRVYTSVLCNSPATVTYFPNPLFITPALLRILIVPTRSRSELGNLVAQM